MCVDIWGYIGSSVRILLQSGLGFKAQGAVSGFSRWIPTLNLLEKEQLWGFHKVCRFGGCRLCGSRSCFSVKVHGLGQCRRWIPTRTPHKSSVLGILP